MSLLPTYHESFLARRSAPDAARRIRLHFSNGTVYGDFTPDQSSEGYENVVFGGTLFGILDVVMWYSIFMTTKKICMTRKTDMDFLKPVICGEPYRVQGKLLRVEERDVWVTAWIEDANLERYAEATALFREPKALDYDRFLSRFDFTGIDPEIREHFLTASKTSM